MLNINILVNKADLGRLIEENICGFSVFGVKRNAAQYLDVVYFVLFFFMRQK